MTAKDIEYWDKDGNKLYQPIKNLKFKHNKTKNKIMKNEFRVGDNVRIKTGEYEGRIGKIYEIKSNRKFPILIIGWGIFGDWDYLCNSLEIEKVE